MRALILAAGKITSDEPSVIARPKAMTHIEERPILEHVLERLPLHIKEVVIVLGQRGDVIQRYFGRAHQGRELHYIWQYQHNENERAIKQARRTFRDSEFLLVDIEKIETIDSIESVLN